MRTEVKVPRAGEPLVRERYVYELRVGPGALVRLAEWWEEERTRRGRRWTVRRAWCLAYVATGHCALHDHARPRPLDRAPVPPFRVTAAAVAQLLGAVRVEVGRGASDAAPVGNYLRLGEFK